MKPINKPVTPKPPQKKKTKFKMPLKTKLRIAAAAGVIGASLLTGSLAKKQVTNISKNLSAKTTNIYHVSKPIYPENREKVIKSKLATLNNKSKPGEIYFWDSKSQKIDRITLDPIRMGNIFRILEYKSQIIEIERVLKEAGGQVWEKHFVNKPLVEVYNELTPDQIKRIEAVVKQIPNGELQYVQRESNMLGSVVGGGVGIMTGLVLASYLAKIKINKNGKIKKKRVATRDKLFNHPYK